MSKILSVNGVLTPYGREQAARCIFRKDGREERPATRGEQLADTEYARASREQLDRKAALEREHQILSTKYFEYGTSRAEQARIGQRLDQISTELNVMRATLGPQKPPVAKTDRARGRDALGTLLHAQPVKKGEPEPWVTSTMTREQKPVQ